MTEPPQPPSAEQALPAALALHWRDVPLPGRVARGCGLERNAVVGDLARPVTPRDGSARVSLRFFVFRLVSSRASRIVGVRIFPGYARPDRATLQGRWPVHIKALAESGLLDDRRRLSALTYQELFAMRGLGTKRILEMGLAAEAMCSPWGETTLEAPGPVDEEGLAALRRIAATDAAQRVSGVDRRFSQLIPDNGACLADIARALMESQEQSGHAAVLDRSGGLIAGPVAVPAWVARIEAEISRLESLTLEDSLGQLFELYTGYQGQRCEALMLRLGWVGRRLVLADAGSIIGVNRERMRQIEDTARARLPAAALYIPALERAVEALTQAAPIEVDRAGQLLQQRGISASAYSPDGVIAAARDLRMEAGLSISEARGCRVVACDRGLIADILHSARRMTGKNGIACVADVVLDVLRRRGAQCAAQDVALALGASPQFLLLCGSWYWATDLPKVRNGLARICTDMLSVTPVLTVARMWSGVSRFYKFLNIRSKAETCQHLPPLEVLRELLRAHPDFNVGADDRVGLARPRDYKQQLQPAQRVMVEVLRKAPGGVLERSKLFRECVRRGASEGMVSRELVYGFLFEHVATNTWGVIGGPMHAAAGKGQKTADAAATAVGG